MPPLLSIQHLSIRFEQDGNLSPAVKNISLDIEENRITAIVGESGSGKSVTALSILQLLPRQAKIEGSIFFKPGTTAQADLSRLSKKEISRIRGKEIAMIFQEPMTALNPVFTCGFQVMETLIQHQKLSKKAAKEKTIALFEQVELPHPAAIFKRYPHQLSGGQKQRVMTAMAISCGPGLLIADEPTTALDVRVQQSIIELLRKIQEQNRMSVLLITHDLGLVADIADDLFVFYKGEIVEKGTASTVLANPQHPYTKALLACRPTFGSKGKKLPVMEDFLEGKEATVTTFEKKTTSADLTDNKGPLLLVEDLRVQFPLNKNIFGKAIEYFKAVDGVSFSVMKQETIGLVGESGCGKTTLGRAILQLLQPSSGKIILNGRDLSRYTAAELRTARKEMQVVFQDPYGSLNPRITIGDAITEPMKVHGLYHNNKERKERTAALLQQVRLQADHFNRYPHQFSGGQRQRICIARALALDPSFLVFDESVSALDVSVQAQVLNLINELKSAYNFTSIFISHDLSVVHYISDRILVMQNGRIVEEGDADKILLSPLNEYTQKLVASIPGKKLQRFS